jgi:hypothetical protein
VTDLSDYLDAVALGGPHGGGGHGGGHHGGGGHHYPRGGGGGYWGGGWTGPSYEPSFLVVDRPAERQTRYLGVRPGERVNCAQRPMADGVWRCADGTVVYDVTRYELRANGLVRRGLAALGAFPIAAKLVAPALAPLAQRQVMTAKITASMLAPLAPRPVITTAARLLPQGFMPPRSPAITPAAPGASSGPGTPCDVLCANGEYVCDPVACSTRGGLPTPSLPGPSRFTLPGGGGGGGTPSGSSPGDVPGATPTPSPCPPGATYDAAQAACVCDVGTIPNADGSACVPNPAGSAGAGAPGGGGIGWLLLIAGAGLLVRSLGR